MNNDNQHLITPTMNDNQQPNKQKTGKLQLHKTTLSLVIITNRKQNKTKQTHTDDNQNNVGIHIN